MKQQQNIKICRFKEKSICIFSKDRKESLILTELDKQYLPICQCCLAADNEMHLYEIKKILDRIRNDIKNIVEVNKDGNKDGNKNGKKLY